MFSTRKYSIRKVSVGIASVLIGITAGSFGTAYAHEDVNNIVVNTEVTHDVNLEHVNKPVLDEPEKIIPKPELSPKPIEPTAATGCADCKHEEKIIEHNRVDVTDKPVLGKSKIEKISLETTSKSTETVLSKPVSDEAVHKEEKLIKSILEDKIDWNTIDEKEFVNYLFAGIKVDKNKEQEIKTVWLVKVKELLEANPNNENLKKVKSILENTLKNESSVEKDKQKEGKVTEEKKENKEVTKETDKKETPKENKVSENKKEKNESVKEDKKDTPKEQTLPKDKKATPGRETSKVTPSKQEATNDKKQETSTNTAKVENHVLSAKLSGRDVAVLFDKDKIKADNVFVGSINDENLNKTIIEKLGSEYKVVEVFEIHFEKDGKKLDSDAERTVKMSVVKNDNAELEVYHIAENNELEKVESSFSEGAVKFKINHFSKFTILERIRVGAKDLESRVQIVTPVKAEHKPEVKKEESDNSDNTNSDKKEGTNNKETEKLPQTGLETTKSLGIVLLALGAAITIRKKQNQ
ncbi:YSIRK-type signal peptide-containing protein [Gemella haemolysans]|uniref:YSIRK Gram-positive signal peptide domain-containing protein n=2 Tax=Gemella haemolysans TaxID=1379 RepID=A0AA87AT59_9BACL|nr:YSIRK-type signal peptide-containing protein [Gemella haemolysans]EGF85725.1 hypothetical protein HMPREF0428_00567 [Gemella haemolysans M341]QIX87605.1 YSIRK-type signal peptide-containing protein [Gemella haemolysans]